MKRLLLSLFLAFSALGTFAQIGESRRAISVGMNAGILMNKVAFTPSIKQNCHVGPTFGLTMRIMSERYFKTYCALQFELNYAQLGWNENILNSKIEPLPDTYQRHLNYFEIPFLARLGWGKESNGLMGFFVVGPQIGYLFSEKSKQSSTWTLDREGNPDRPNGMFAQYSMSVSKKFDYGIAAGAGMELNTKAGHFVLEGRYYYGLSDLFGNSKKDVFSRSNNGTIQAKITYLFDIRKESPKAL